MVRHWRPDEVLAALKGYARATLNLIVGEEQEFYTFVQEVELCVEELLFTTVEECVFHYTGLPIYPYLRDNVFHNFQRFNKVVWRIYACNPTGGMEHQKCNMAVALFLGKVKSMEYV